ncbi:sodium-dependent transporter [Halolamina rubra]|uniref:sodium-dependent transporter n=1 Tax=Halolamina rubra TaxID=1380430 RepID=UPI0006786959|nr:sodium-dependent transporter [Halolamina rubra]
MSERETWTTRVGFIFAAVGSAVGLGNIWSFPFQTGSNGGAAFLLIYLLAVFLIGFPAMMMEFVIGRGSSMNPISAFEKLGYGNWSVAGALGVFTSIVTLAFYSVVGGWVISYIAGSLTGAYFGDAGTFFGAVSAGPTSVLTHALFMAITIGIVAFGIQNGIEKATKVMIPAIIVLLVGLAAWGATLDGAAAGYEYYLSPDFGYLAANFASIVPSAVGQAFFTLSLGFSVMVAYASYLGRDDSLPADGGAIVVVNTLVALLAGFVVFPVLFAIGAEPGSGGLGAAFVSLAGAFGQIPGGSILGFVFFIILLLAALSSSISLLETPTSYVVDNYDYSRKQVATGLGALVWAVGIPTALSTNTLGWYNAVVFNLLLPVVVLLFAVFVGWVASDLSADEIGRGTTLDAGFATTWLWWVRIVIPVAIGLTLVLGIQSLLIRAGVLEAAVILG